MKYNNRKITIDGITFDSTREANRWCELKLLERANKITDLSRQVSFVLIDNHRRDDGKLERGVKYIADFTYRENGKFVVEDAKGVRTKEYIIKRKLMLDRYGISIREV